MIVAICDGVAICDCMWRNLWRVSRFVTESVAFCDVKMCNLMQYIQSISINMLFFHLMYTNMRLIHRICSYMVSATLTYLYTSSEWCQKITTILPGISRALFQCNYTHSRGSSRHLMFDEWYTIYMANNTEMAKPNLSDSCQKWTLVLSEGHRTHFQCYWTEFTTARTWSQIATNHKLRRQGFLICRNLWLSQFVTVQNTTSQFDVNSARGYTPKYSKHVHIDIGPFQELFLCTSIMGFKLKDKQKQKKICRHTFVNIDTYLGSFKHLHKKQCSVQISFETMDYRIMYWFFRC